MEHRSAYTELETHILNILNDNPNGLSDDNLSKKLKNVDITSKTEALNKLLEKTRIMVVSQDNGELAYKYIDEEEAQRRRELSPEEYVVYQFIEESGNKGMWINDIKKVTKLAAKAGEIVKKLEKKGFIKSVKTIKAKNKKVWMVMNVEPSQEVTGGMLADDVFDRDLMDLLGQKCVEFIRAQGRCDRKQVSIFIRSLSLSQIDLSDEDIFRILETQVFDGRIEIVDDVVKEGYLQSSSGTVLPNNIYKVSNWYTPRLIFNEIP